MQKRDDPMILKVNRSSQQLSTGLPPNCSAFSSVQLTFSFTLLSSTDKANDFVQSSSGGLVELMMYGIFR